MAIYNIRDLNSQNLEGVKTLFFEIKDSKDKAPLSSVNCRVYTEQGKFSTFGISDKDGKLSIAVSSKDMLEFSYIGYGTIKSKADTFSTNHVNMIELNEEAFNLREIIVKAPPIRKNNDTLSYNVKSFVKSGDIHLEDVLKKLPGIKVADNGTISYQGKAINKFYIEGQDLLGNSYNQATRNMPVDAVTTIEVMENHQPIKMLHGQKFSDNAALNIKIDRTYKSRPFGEIILGIGGTPTIWDNRLFLTQIFDKKQLLITGKMNNIGVDISDDTKEHIDITDLDAYEPAMSSLLPSKGHKETLKQDRYLHNKSYSSGINYLVSLSPDATLRTNILLYNDCSSLANSYNSIYRGIENISISEANNIKQHTLTILPIIKYELNSKKAYISNEFRYSFNRYRMENNLKSNAISFVENICNNPSYFQNYYTSAFQIGKQTVEVKSLLRYFNREEKLRDTTDSIAFHDISEDYISKSFISKNILSTSFPLLGNMLKLTTKIHYKNNVYDYCENVRNRKLHFLFSPNYDISFGTERLLSIDVPIELFCIKNRENSRNLLSVNPSLYFKFGLTDKWKFVFSASMSTDNTMIDFYSLHNLRIGYRTLYIPNDEVFINWSKRFSVRLNYSDLYSMFFSNLSISYTDDKKEFYTNYNYTDSLTTISYVRNENHRRMFVVNASVDKSFIDAGISVKSEIGYNNTSYLLSQSGIQTYNKSNVLNINISTIYQKIDWLRLTMEALGNLYWEHNSFFEAKPLKSFVCNASVFIFPFKDMDLKLKYQNYINEISSSNYKSCGIFDFDFVYRLNKKWEIGCSITNLLNTKQYILTKNTGINFSQYILPLRGREVLFKISCRI